MQAYREMDIGTAKPDARVQSRIPHRLIDIAEPEDVLTARTYQAHGRAALDEARETHGRVVICGGSGLHFRALVDPMTFAPTDETVRAELEALDPDVAVELLLAADPGAADHVDIRNPRRVVRALEILELTGANPTERSVTPEARAIASYEPAHPFVGLGIDPGEAIAERVERRFDAMLDAGLLAEVERLRHRLGPTASQAVGYRQLVPVVEGRIPLTTAREDALAATRALVKRQRTFFGRDPRIDWQPWQDEGGRRIDAVLDVIRERTSWTS